MNTKNKTVLAVLLLTIGYVLVFPFALIWALNTLFNLSIAYGFFEWLAAFILLATVKETGVKFQLK
jgi:hypothetical protein